MRRALPVLLVPLALFACALEDSPVQPADQADLSPDLAIVDGSREGGNPGFFWDRPINPNPAFDIYTDFDPSLLPFLAVEVCEWDGEQCVGQLLRRFTSEGDELLPESHELEHLKILDPELHPRYGVWWFAADDAVVVGKTYRISVKAGPVELGFADVDVADGVEVWGVDTDEFVGINKGWALNIEFVVGGDVEGVGVVGPGDGGRVTLGDDVEIVIPPHDDNEDLLIGIGPVPVVTLPPDRVLQDCIGAVVPFADGFDFIDGTVFELVPDGIPLNGPTEVTIRYDENALPPGFDEEDLMILWSEDGVGWFMPPEHTLDTDANTVTTWISPTDPCPPTGGRPRFLGVDPWHDGPTARDDFVSVPLGGTVSEPAATGLLSNDLRGRPPGSLVSFGGGALAGSVLTNPDGSTVSLAGGTLTIRGDGSFDVVEPTVEGTFVFDYRIANNRLRGESDATVTVRVGPLTPGPPRCNACGDVHMRTPDGLAYDFQGAGEFLFVASDDGSVVVQVRMAPWRSSAVASVNTAVAMNVGGDRIGVYSGRSPALYVDGQPTELVAGTLALANGGRVHRLDRSSRTEYLVEWPNGFVTGARLGGSYMDVGVSSPLGLPASFAGLVGNLNGQAADDIQTRDGVVFGFPILFDELYQSFGDSWRVSAAESLFDYEPGTSTETFQLFDFPLRRVSIADFDQTVVDAARQSCEAAGIQDPTLLEDCILDLAVTGEEEFVESAAGSEPPTSTVGVVEVVNGGFDLNAEGWFWANLDGAGGWRSAGGNPGGRFALNQAGQRATDPQACQVVQGLEAGKGYRITGDYASFAPSFGNPAKPDAFAVTLDGAVVLELPRPAPVSTAWTAFSTDVITGAANPTICFVAERDGDDSSFLIDNIALRGTQSPE